MKRWAASPARGWPASFGRRRRSTSSRPPGRKCATISRVARSADDRRWRGWAACARTRAVLFAWEEGTNPTRLRISFPWRWGTEYQLDFGRSRAHPRPARQTLTLRRRHSSPPGSSRRRLLHSAPPAPGQRRLSASLCRLPPLPGLPGEAPPEARLTPTPTAQKRIVGLMGKQMKSSFGTRKQIPKRKPAKFQFDNIPESLFFTILQFLPLRDAARASCVDRNWLHAWRLYPNLEFTTKSLGLKKRIHTDKRKAKSVRCVNAIIRNHAGTGVKSFTVKRNLNNQKYAHYLDRWIYFAVSSGAKELTLDLVPRWHPHHRDIQYSFPSSNFAAPEHTSIEHLKLCFCYLRPSPTFIGLSNLKTLDLSYVRIAGEDLGSLLSCTLALEQLKLKFCPGLDYLKLSDVPCKLNYLDVRLCWLKAMEIGVQNPVTFNYYGAADVKLIPNRASVLKEANFELTAGDAVEFAFSELAPHVPKLETLFLSGFTEMVVPVWDPSNRFHCSSICS